MWKHFVKIAGRNLLRNRAYTLINLIGLSSGMAICLIILLFIRFEWNYEGFHPETDRLYRVVQQFGVASETRGSRTGMPMGPNLALAFPEIETAIRVHQKEGLINIAGASDRLREPNIFYSDSSFFEVFGFPLLNGVASKVLNTPGAAVLSEAAALRIFGHTDVVGKQIQVDEKLTLQITGLAANPPGQTDISFSIVASIEGLKTIYGTQNFDSWWWPSVQTFVQLNPDNKPSRFDQVRALDFVNTYREPGIDIFPVLQPIQHIRRYGDPGGAGSIRYILLFGIIASIVLLIACVNFMNLATARAASRVLEVGVKKAIGAQRSTLIAQFMGESIILAGLALILGLGLAELLLPFFEKLSTYSLSIPWNQPSFWLIIVGMLLLTSLLAGLYPAFFLSRFTPLDALKRGKNQAQGGGKLRQGLVIFQFIISATLIASTLLIQAQHRFMLSKELGFDQEQVLVIELQDAATQKNYLPLREALKALPQTEAVSAASWAPGTNLSISFPAEVEDEFGKMVSLEGVNIMYVDYDFFTASGIAVNEGRKFSQDFPADENSGFILNQAALNQMGTGPYIDREVRIFYGEYDKILYEKKGQVKGMVADFHMLDLHSNVRPTLITLRNENELGYLSKVITRLKPGDHVSAREAIEKVWQELNPGYPLSLYFANDRIENSYSSERQLGYLLATFAGFAILIACLGLLGLATFTAQQRNKEIGIRKVLGATSAQIQWLLQREFGLLVGIALVTSLPVAYFMIQEWLKEYPYQMAFSVGPYLMTVFILVVITWLSVGLMSYSAARRNPIDSLRHE